MGLGVILSPLRILELPEARLGLLATAGGTQRLSKTCGRATAKRLILGAEMITGIEALRLGVVQWAVPSEDVAAFAAQTAKLLCRNQLVLRQHRTYQHASTRLP